MGKEPSLGFCVFITLLSLAVVTGILLLEFYPPIPSASSSAVQQLVVPADAPVEVVLGMTQQIVQEKERADVQ